MTRSLKSAKLRQPEHAGIDDRGHADAEREAVRIDAVVARVRAALARAGITCVWISISPGVTYSPGTSTTLRGLRRVDLAATAAILPSLMATSRTASDFVLRVDDVAASQEEVVVLRRCRKPL